MEKRGGEKPHMRGPFDTRPQGHRHSFGISFRSPEAREISRMLPRTGYLKHIALDRKYEEFLQDCSKNSKS